MSEALISAVNYPQTIIANASAYNLEFLVANATTGNTYQLKHTPLMVWVHGAMEFSPITLGTQINMYKMFSGGSVNNEIKITVSTDNILKFNVVDNGGFYFLLIFAY